jgi:hypothetical protein
MATIDLTCPHCSAALHIPEVAWYYTCEYCKARLDLKSQFAYLRGLDAFEEGQTLMVSKGPHKQRNKTRENPVYRHVLDLFTEAYSSLQVAFLADLGELQRQVGVEMMASMSAEFFRQNMISPLEMTYWASVMTEQSAQEEYDKVKGKMGTLAGAFGIIKQLRWQLRLNQLGKKLPELSQKIERIERQIAFIEAPHSRNRKWKP